jgi:hypothetical protein
MSQPQNPWPQALFRWGLQITAVQRASRSARLAPPPRLSHSQAMTGPMLDVDLAEQEVAEARERNDAGQEGAALSMLAQALYEAGREDESYEISVQAAQVAWGSSARCDIRRSQAAVLLAHATRMEEAAGPKPSGKATVPGRPPDESWYLLLRGAAHAYLQAERIFYDQAERTPYELDIYDGSADKARHGYHRVWEQAQPWIYTSLAQRKFPAYNQLETRFPVCSLGPFIEVLARQLGQQLEELTTSALGRLHLSQNQLGVNLPGSAATLVLPRRLTDTVCRGILNLHLTGTAAGDATLYWDRTAAIWRQAESDEDARALSDPTHGCWIFRYAWMVTDPRRGYPRYTYSKDTLCETCHEAEMTALDGAWSGDDGVSLAEIQVRQLPDGAWQRSRKQRTAVNRPSPSLPPDRPRDHDQGIRGDQRARTGRRYLLGEIVTRLRKGWVRGARRV